MMNSTHLDNKYEYSCWKEVGIGILASLLLFCCFYPQFLLFITTPMHANGWELSDPSVSWANFKPSFRVIQYELYNNLNILWSSMRTMGMPVLANDIQAAPLFPLTLLLGWLHEDIFWNVFVVSRLVLLGLGVYLLARRTLLFQRLPSLFFVVTFVYALYVMRWMNNPWQNGLLSGVWYLYFLCLTLEVGSQYTYKRLLVFFGLVLSVLMMVTCGFPEASVMCAILVVLTFVPLIISRWLKGTIAWKAFLSDLVLAHLAGFALSSYQIISIVELLAASESHRFVGLRQYGAADLFPFFAENLTRFGNSVPKLYSDSKTFLGLIPTTFFLLGILTTFLRPRKIGAAEVGALLCGLFIIFKMFALGPAWFNEIVAKPPVLRESYFYVYFFSIFLWFFAYFSAKGFQNICNIPRQDHTQKNLAWKTAAIIIPCVVLVLLWLASGAAVDKNIFDLLFQEKQKILAGVIGVFVIMVLLLQVRIYLDKYKLLLTVTPFLVLVLAVVESRITLPYDFFAWRRTDDSQLNEVLNRLKAHDVPLTESRIIDRNGTYVSSGLATIDTGATPLLPRRTQVFRTNFFRTIRAGHLSIEQTKSRYSWGLTSTNMRSMDRYFGGGEDSFPDWESWKRMDGGSIHYDRFIYNGEARSTGGKLNLTGGIHDFFYFSGWGVGDTQTGLENTKIYLVFMDGNREFIAPVRKAVRHDVAEHLGDPKFIMAGWDSYISASLLETGNYRLVIRLADESSKTYYEHVTDSIIQFKRILDDDKEPFLFGVDEKEKLFLGVLEQYYVYLDRSALPRAYLATGCENFSEMKEVVNRFRTTTTFELGQVYMEELSEDEQQFCSNYSRDLQRVPILRDGGDDVVLGEVEGPAILVLNDNLYPGWKAFDRHDNSMLEIKPGNITFRSIILPEAKKYNITFRYVPAWLNIARILVIIGIIALFLPLLLTLKRSWNRYGV